MKGNCYELTVAQGATLEWPLEESIPWTTGSGTPRRRATAATAKVERRAAAKARRVPATARARPRSPEADRQIHDRAMSTASGWFFVPPHG